MKKLILFPLIVFSSLAYSNEPVSLSGLNLDMTLDEARKASGCEFKPYNNKPLGINFVSNKCEKDTGNLQISWSLDEKIYFIRYEIRFDGYSDLRFYSHKLQNKYGYLSSSKASIYAGQFNYDWYFDDDKIRVHAQMRNLKPHHVREGENLDSTLNIYLKDMKLSGKINIENNRRRTARNLKEREEEMLKNGTATKNADF